METKGAAGGGVSMTTTALAERFSQTLSQRERHVLMLHYCDRISTADIGLLVDLSAFDVECMLIELRRRARTMRQVASLAPGDGVRNGVER